MDYRRRVFEKNGAGRVIYFDLVMVSEESLKHLDDRKEVYNEQNEPYKPFVPIVYKSGKKERRTYSDNGTLGERSQRK